MEKNKKRLTPIIAATSWPFSRLWSKKGLTPIIAVILLLMMTVAAAGAAFFWFIRIQSEMQGGTEVYTEQLSEKVSASVQIERMEYNSGTKNLSIYLKNTGNVAVPLDASGTSPTTTWILQDSNQNVICSTNWADAASPCVSGCNTTLPVRGRATVVLNLAAGNSCDISSSTTYPNDTIFYVTIDFSGLTATGGSFTK